MRVMLGSDRGSQPVLLPTDARDLLPPDHAAWTYMDIVNDQMDMSAFRAYYRADGRGRPPYDPAMMVALLLYCGSKRIYYSRDVEQACKDDLGCRVITGNRAIDHSTISAFRRTHGIALRELLAQSVRLCDQAGLIDLDLLAVDGTKWAANAAMSATLDEATLRTRIEDLTAQVAERDALWRETVAAGHGTQPGLFDPDPDPDPDPAAAGHASPAGPVRGPAGKAWRQLRQAQRALHTHQRALEHLLAHPTNSTHTGWQEKLARANTAIDKARQRLEQTRTELAAAAQARTQRQAAGARMPGTRPVPIDQHTRTRKAQTALDNAITRAEHIAAHPPTAGTVNITDPTSRIMPNKHGGHDQNHNVQIAAVRTQVILGIYRHDNPNDKQALKPVLETIRVNLDAAGITRPIGTAVCDNGYASQTNFTTRHPVTCLLVATRGGGGNDPAEAVHPAWQDMADKIAQPENRKLYKERAAIIEPVFAQLFTRYGRRLNHTGEHADTELHLWATGHNLAKLIRHRRREHDSTRPPT